MADARIDSHHDILIVGAGLSGIDAAYRFQTLCPAKSYAVLEARDAIGGTWDLFRYPGIRSDSDMHTLGFPFHPWTGDRSIAGGDAIRDYIADTAHRFGIDRRIRVGHHVVRARWTSADALWTLDVRVADRDAPLRMTCRFLYMGSGYYDYAGGYTPDFAGMADYGGTIVHPQRWPAGLDHAGKRVVVIGSGATAVSLVPALAGTAAHVTMLQRSPGYIVSRPAADGFARWARARLPARTADRAARWKNILLGLGTYNYARRRPASTKAAILKGVRAQLPADYPVERDFAPDYDPWDQRLCLVPDADLFVALRSGRATIVTDRIDRFTATGLRLASGADLPADIVVTATGLVVKLLGGVELVVDGAVVNPADRMIYKGLMLADVPNMALAFGYTNASWTLKCDLSARYACRLLDHMDRHGATICTARGAGADVADESLLGFTSGYVRRAAGVLPRQGLRAPWKVRQNYIADRAALTFGSVEDKVMTFTTATGKTHAIAQPAPPPPAPVPRAAIAAGVGIAAVAGLALFAKWHAARVERRVPADGRFFEQDGHRLHYVDRGAGPAIVMIHGLGGQLRNFSYALLDRLAATHRVILVDRPGSGYSDPLAATSLAAQAAAIARLIAALGLDRSLVVGHSLGGSVALALALDHPAQVGRLALIAPFTCPRDDVPEAFRALAIRSPTARRAFAWTIATPAALLVGDRGTRAAFAPEPVPADFAIRGGGALIARPGAMQAAGADMAAAHRNLPVLARRFPGLTHPVAVLFGRQDDILDPMMNGAGFVASVPGARLTLIDGGHMLPITRPDETVAWLLAQSDEMPR